MIQMSSKQSQISSNLYALPRMLQTCISNTQMCLSDTLYVNLQWNWMTVSLCCEAVTKLKKKPSSVSTRSWIQQPLKKKKLCRHIAWYHHLVMWKTRHLQAHSLRPKVNNAWEIKQLLSGVVLCWGNGSLPWGGHTTVCFWRKTLQASS